MPSQLATERKLIFTNLLNGVPIEQVAQNFHRQTEKEVMEDFRFVVLKIKCYAFQRVMPYIPMETVAEARTNKLQLLALVEKLNLDVLPVYSSIYTQPVEEVYG